MTTPASSLVGVSIDHENGSKELSLFFTFLSVPRHIPHIPQFVRPIIPERELGMKARTKRTPYLLPPECQVRNIPWVLGWGMTCLYYLQLAGSGGDLQGVRDQDVPRNSSRWRCDVWDRTEPLSCIRNQDCAADATFICNNPKVANLGSQVKSPTLHRLSCGHNDQI